MHILSHAHAGYDASNASIELTQQFNTPGHLSAVDLSLLHHILQNLDFDFEKCCSVSLSPINVYVCLVCGKYFQVGVQQKIKSQPLALPHSKVACIGGAEIHLLGTHLLNDLILPAMLCDILASLVCVWDDSHPPACKLCYQHNQLHKQRTLRRNVFIASAGLCKPA